MIYRQTLTNGVIGLGVLVLLMILFTLGRREGAHVETARRATLPETL
jgi:hypothetical protein